LVFSLLSILSLGERRAGEVRADGGMTSQ